ncbi:MAG: anthranilate synthase component I [Gammaproteobacteria bacterium]|tara:strand:- start:486 stop:1952 length:1467 start_codon:yes stop_codon:yes gene_type:complete
MITSKEYDELKLEGFNIIPLIKEIDSDSDSPTSLYSRIKDKRNSFLLESIEGGEKWAQYSIIGLDCKDTIKVTGNKIEIKNNEATTILESKDPLNELDNILTKFKSPNLENMPRFYGGYVGFFAYESAQYAEEKIRSLQNKNSKFKEHMPEIYLVKSEKLIVYDNFNQTMHAIYNSDPASTSFKDALDKLNEIENSIDQSHSYIEPSYKSITGNFEFESNFTKNEFIHSVNTVKDYIEEGDVMQVVLAQDFYRSFEGDSFKLYSALRQLNPSPYMYYLNLDECEVVGSSPEILVRVEDDDITLRPIAGTRKRGKDKKEDQSNENDLLNDPKELAEHLMLIDLGRNDVGRVSDIGSVKLTEKMVIEKYSHVMHIVSNVVGTLSKGLNFIDALKATLPAGTLSGAPKIRAMEIINELEPSSRGIYGGAIGYISWNGNIDTAIAIRTAVIKDKLIHVGAGAGIVADSDPESEWLECKQKAKVFLDAMEMIS